MKISLCALLLCFTVGLGASSFGAAEPTSRLPGEQIYTRPPAPCTTGDVFIGDDQRHTFVCVSRDTWARAMEAK